MEEGEEAQIQRGVPQAQDPTAPQGAKVPADQVPSYCRSQDRQCKGLILLVVLMKSSRMTRLALAEMPICCIFVYLQEHTVYGI